jgi:DNA-binding response OmpR family regulator
VTEPDPSILLVEDDESLRRILARHLRSRGYRVDEAASVEEADGLLRAGNRPVAVILDINLPGETGWSFLRGPARAAAGSPPVVIESAVPISPRRLAEFDVAACLAKPFSIDALVSTVDRMAGWSRHAR